MVAPEPTQLLIRRITEGAPATVNVVDDTIDIDVLVTALNASTQLKALSLTFGIGGQGEFERVVTAIAANDGIERLEFPGSAIGDAGVARVCSVLQFHPSLVSLHLESNRLSSQGARQLAGSLWREPRPALRSLKLTANDIGDAGIVAVAAALKTTRCFLASLLVGANKIGDEGARELAVALHHNTSLRELGLDGNLVHDMGARKLAEALHKNSALRILDLSLNAISDDGAIDFAKALAVNRTLRVLNLVGNQFNHRGSEKLVVAHLNRVVLRDAQGGLGGERRIGARSTSGPRRRAAPVLRSLLRGGKTRSSTSLPASPACGVGRTRVTIADTALFEKPVRCAASLPGSPAVGKGHSRSGSPAAVQLGRINDRLARAVSFGSV